MIRAGQRRSFALREVAVERRAPIMKAYLAQAPGARPHIPVDQYRPVTDFEVIAADYPVL